MEDTLYVSLFLKEDWVFKCYILGKAITKLSENADGGLEVLQGSAVRPWWSLGGGSGGKAPEALFLCQEDK